MTAPVRVEKSPDHSWTAWKYDRSRRRWYRHCQRTCCTAVESAARGQKPKH